MKGWEAISAIIALSLSAQAFELSKTNTTNAWWHYAVIYQIYPKSFKDTNGDGIGDLKGIIDSVDYLSGLGINAVWLGPIYPSGGADNGYDPVNMTDIDPVFGTFDDFRNLVATLKKKNIKLIMDLVPNHTSKNHIWFQKSSNPNDAEYEKYKDYYVWMDGKNNNNDPPNNWLTVMKPECDLSKDCKWDSAWTKHEGRNQWYFHQFLNEQPDLNYSHPEVIAEMIAIMKFWLNEGVIGFRMDAVAWLTEINYDQDIRPNPKTYYDYDHSNNEDVEGTYIVLEEFSHVLNISKSDRILFTESYSNDFSKILRYYDSGISFPMNMDLVKDINRQLVDSVTFSEKLIEDIVKWLDKNTIENFWPNWILGNHDNSRLGSRSYEAFVDAMNMLVMALPGTVITYQGEEIGMLDGFVRNNQRNDSQGRDPERTPFQWSSNATAGFSDNPNTWLPINSDAWNINVEKQNDGPSHLNVYKKAVKLKSSEIVQKGISNGALENRVFYVSSFINNTYQMFYIANLNFHDVDISLKSVNFFTATNRYIPPSLKVYLKSVNSDNQYHLSSNTVDTHSIKLAPLGAAVLVTDDVNIK